VGGAGRARGTVVDGDCGALAAVGVGAGADCAAGFAVRAGGVVVAGDRRCGVVALAARRGSATCGRRGAAVGGLDGGASRADPPGGSTTSGTSRGDASLPGDPLSLPVPASAAIDQPVSSATRPTSIAPRGGRRCCIGEAPVVVVGVTSQPTPFPDEV